MSPALDAMKYINLSVLNNWQQSMKSTHLKWQSQLKPLPRKWQVRAANDIIIAYRSFWEFHSVPKGLNFM